MLRPTLFAALAVAAAGCGKDADPGGAGEPSRSAPAGAWRCFVADPSTPRIEAGNVTHMKERLVGDRFETENVNVRRGVTGASRFVYRKVGDHFEAPMGDGTLILKLVAPDASRRIVHFEDPSGWKFTDVTVIDDRGMTITSTDYDGFGKPVETTLHHLPAPCYVVDAELAKYPP